MTAILLCQLGKSSKFEVRVGPSCCPPFDEVLVVVIVESRRDLEIKWGSNCCVTYLLHF